MTAMDPLPGSVSQALDEARRTSGRVARVAAMLVQGHRLLLVYSGRADACEFFALFTEAGTAVAIAGQ